MPILRLERLNKKSSGAGRNPRPKKGEKKMAEVNFGKLFGTLAKNLCEDCGLRAGEWAGNADGGQNLCEPCAMREDGGEGCQINEMRQNFRCGNVGTKEAMVKSGTARVYFTLCEDCYGAVAY